MEDLVGFVVAEVFCFALASLHFATARNPDRNIATRLTMRWWKYWVETPPFGYSPFATPLSAIKFEAWGLTVLGAALFLLFGITEMRR